MIHLVLNLTIICLLGFHYDLAFYDLIILEFSFQYQTSLRFSKLALAIQFTVLEVSNVGGLVLVIVKCAFAIHQSIFYSP